MGQGYDELSESIYDLLNEDGSLVEGECEHCGCVDSDCGCEEDEFFDCEVEAE